MSPQERSRTAGRSNWPTPRSLARSCGINPALLEERSADLSPQERSCSAKIPLASRWVSVVTARVFSKTCWLTELLKKVLADDNARDARTDEQCGQRLHVVKLEDFKPNYSESVFAGSGRYVRLGSSGPSGIPQTLTLPLLSSSRQLAPAFPQNCLHSVSGSAPNVVRIFSGKPSGLLRASSSLLTRRKCSSPGRRRFSSSEMSIGAMM